MPKSSDSLEGGAPRFGFIHILFAIPVALFVLAFFWGMELLFRLTYGSEGDRHA